MLQRVAAEYLKNKRCLIVVDDPPEIIDNILTALDFGENVNFLVTTQNKQLLRSKGVAEKCILELRSMNNKDAWRLLSLWVFDRADERVLPKTAREVATKCENHPLALAMIGAIIRGEINREVAWKDILAALKEGDLQDISHQVDSYEVRSLPLVFEKSLGMLNENMRDHFMDLAVFPQGWKISMVTLSRIWGAYKDRQVRQVVRALLDKSLLESIGHEQFTIHALLRLHIRRKVANLGFLYQQIGPRLFEDVLPLHLAIEWADEEAVESLIKSGINVDEVRSNGVTALHIAVEYSYTGIVRILLEAGAMVDRSFINGSTSLHIAALHGYSDIANILIEHGATVDQQTIDGFSPLQYASREGYVDTVSLLMAHGARVELQNKGRKTALYIAAMHGHTEIVRILLKSQPLIVQQTDPQETPLRLAAARGYADAVRVLLDAGAEVNWSAPDDAGTALHLAAQYGHLDVVRVLLEKGAAVDQQGANGQTALLVAALNNQADIVQVIAEKGAVVDPEMEGGITALHLVATDANYVGVVRSLIEAGAAINQPTHKGWTALHFAAESWNLKAIHLLIEAGVAINPLTNNGWTALHIAAAQSWRMKISDDLQRTSFSMDEKGVHISSASVMEATTGAAVIKALVQAGANIEARTMEGQTPLHLAIQSGDIICIQALLEAGSLPNETDNDGNTALDLAKKIGNREVVEILLGRKES